MIRIAEVGVEHLLSAGPLAAGRGFDRHKYGIDRLHKLRVLYFQYPTPLCFGIDAQKSQAMCRLRACFQTCPDLETTRRTFRPAFIQIECVKSERLPFGKENASKGLAVVAIRVSVADVNDMQLAGRHKFPDIATGSHELPFLVEGRTRNSQFIGEIRNPCLLLHHGGFVVDPQLATAGRLVSGFRQQLLLVSGLFQQVCSLAVGLFCISTWLFPVASQACDT